MFLHLHVLLLQPGFPSPTVSALPCCRLYYLTLSKPGQAHRNILESDQCRLITSMYPICFGGPGGNRTLVQHAFALKELQQFF
jgi:hypothetical protein